MSKALKVGGTATYVGSNVGPGGAIKHGDRVRVVRIIGSAVRIVPASLPATSKRAMRSAFVESGVGVNDAFLIPDMDRVHMKKATGPKASEYKKLATATSLPGIEKHINEFAYSTNYRVDPATLQISNPVKAPPEGWFVMPYRGGFLFGRKH